MVVTGAAGGIGRALARAAHAAGARGLALSDIQATGIDELAAELNSTRPGSAISVPCDIGTEAGNDQLIGSTEAAFGQVDVFFANAGVGGGTDLEQTAPEGWRSAFAVNIEAHIHAATRLVPGWVARGEGYFCSTASAAGLLTQIGSGPYSVTKHAAVGFAEWLSVTYHDRGVRVSCLCPMGVNTNMLNGSSGGVDRLSGDVVRAAGMVLEPDEVAAIVLDHIDREQFLILPHPEVATFEQRKAQDRERWLAGMRRLQSRVAGA